MIAEETRRAFQTRFGCEPRGVAIAPGRVNLMGEHTDYNDGFVLPVAIDRWAAVAYEANDAGVLHGVSLLLEQERMVGLDPPSPTGTWMDYVAGVVLVHQENGVEIPGMSFVAGGDVPLGAGLSSSAALELAAARAVVDLASGSWDPAAEAALAREAENDFVGMPCGIMDPMAAALSQEGCAMLLDCRSLDYESVPLPEGVLVVVMDTGTRRALKDSAYRDRRRSCEEAARALGVRALRDASRGALERLDETTRRRARHVLDENERALWMTEALLQGDERCMGLLMRQSHVSLRDRFEVSSPALDAMVEIAWSHRAVIGARMTGGGFAGCAVALVRSEEAEGFVRDVEADYREKTGQAGKLHACRAVSGAELVWRAGR